MLVGYNTNISYKNKVYHIQTEDSGKNNPVILTLVYSQGAILASRKTSYAHLVDDPDFQEKVRKLMKIQHKGMIRELTTGKYTTETKEESEISPAPAEEVKETKDVQEVIKIQQAVKQSLEETFEKESSEIREEPVSSTETQITAKDQMTRSLDDILLSYIMNRKK
jgi:hypothetical protein